MHFGIAMVLNVSIGHNTPVGTLIFIACTAGDVKVEEFIDELWPFLLSMIALLFFVTFGPI